MATVEEEDLAPMVYGGPREHRATTLWQVIRLFHSHLKENVTASDVAETHRLPKGRND